MNADQMSYHRESQLSGYGPGFPLFIIDHPCHLSQALALYMQADNTWRQQIGR